jgi:hypothetical protein
LRVLSERHDLLAQRDRAQRVFSVASDWLVAVAQIGIGHIELCAEQPNSVQGKFAKLAGQAPEYILKQIEDFRPGARKHDRMAIMARSVSDEDVVDIAACASCHGANGKGHCASMAAASACRSDCQVRAS